MLLKRLTSPLAELFYRLYAGLMNIIDFVLAAPAQKLVGKTNRMGYFFVLPNMLIFGIFILFPVFLNAIFSVTGGVNLFPNQRPFVGFENYQTLFTCQNIFQPNTCSEDLFWRGLLNTFVFVNFQVAGMVLISLLTALILNRRIVARGFFRSVFFYPVLLSPIVVALIWKWILQKDGLLNALIVALGGAKIDFLTNTNWAQFWSIIISVWAQMGFFTLILLAGLQSIPAELYEAGDMDGTSRGQAFRFITFPLLMPTLLVVVVLALIRAVQVFDIVFALTGGIPVYLVQYIYDKAFGSAVRNYGMAAAASIVLGVALLIFTLIQLRLGRRSDTA